ncbi:hypothetical protein NQ317_012960 [Molorchus minor]|uniref:Ig-like domain-containing protein n=1 Tax=Molorchus minor TaxID=1323400 RepID=A0ABQ9IXJ3_9CUCU|nr:hypothetical protein NQ317_012960 [Molorchus minor]
MLLENGLGNIFQGNLSTDPYFVWDTSVVRKTVPQTSTESSRPQRKPAHYIHKANTIGIPTEGELSDSGDSKLNGPKPRMNFFGGFRNTLKSKHKSDTVVLEAGKENEKNDLHRRWSENAHATCDTNVMAPGTQARLVCEWPDLTSGGNRHGYFVRTNATLEETWVLTHVLSNYTRKPWSFRFKKGRRLTDENVIVESEGSPPEFRDKLKDITVQSGTKVVLKCRVKNCGPNSRSNWKKLEPNLFILKNGRFLQGDHDEAVQLF